MDESDGLENRYRGNSIVGSNPTPSARSGIIMTQTTQMGSGPFTVMSTDWSRAFSVNLERIAEEFLLESATAGN